MNAAAIGVPPIREAHTQPGREIRPRTDSLKTGSAGLRIARKRLECRAPVQVRE